MDTVLKREHDDKQCASKDYELLKIVLSSIRGDNIDIIITVTYLGWFAGGKHVLAELLKHVARRIVITDYVDSSCFALGLADAQVGRSLPYQLSEVAHFVWLLRRRLAELVKLYFVVPKPQFRSFSQTTITNTSVLLLRTREKVVP